MQPASTSLGGGEKGMFDHLEAAILSFEFCYLKFTAFSSFIQNTVC